MDRETVPDEMTSKTSILAGSSVTIVSHAGLFLLGFGSHVLMARWLEASDLGMYYSASAAIMIIVSVVVFGLDGAIERYGSAYMAKKRYDRFAGLMKFTLVLVLVLAGISMLLVRAFSPQAALHLLHEPRAASTFAFMAFVIPVAAVEIVLVAFFRTTLMFNVRALHIGLLYPGGRLLAIALALKLFGATAPVAAAATALGGLVAICVSALISSSTLRLTTIRSGWLPPSSIREVLGFCTPLLGANVTLALRSNVLLILLGAMLSVADVAFFGVAMRCVLMGETVLVAMNMVIGPMIARALGASEKKRADDLYQLGGRLILLVSAPVIVAMLCAPEGFLLLFGSKFLVSAAALQVISLGTFVNVATASCGLYLKMSGHSGGFFLGKLLAAVTVLATSAVLIPAFGLIGAGMALALSVTVDNLTMLVLVWKHERVLPFSNGYITILMGTLASIAVVMAVERVGILERGLVFTISAAVASLAIVTAFAWVRGGLRHDLATIMARAS